MPVRDLRAGMQGIGKTVISGDTIETFNVEILGVNGSEAMGYNIFVRLYGDLIEKTGGVAQGMSGSPVYVDGRLVGAVAVSSWQQNNNANKNTLILAPKNKIFTGPLPVFTS